MLREVVKSGGLQSCRERVALHHASLTVQPERHVGQQDVSKEQVTTRDIAITPL